MNMEPERHNWNYEGMTCDNEGRYVKYSDYLILQVRVERLSIEVQKLTVALRTADTILAPIRAAAQKTNEAFIRNIP